MLTPTGENCYTLHFPLCVRDAGTVSALVGLITSTTETTNIVVRCHPSVSLCLNDYRVLHTIFSNTHNINSVAFHGMMFKGNAAQILVAALVFHRPLNRLLFIDCCFVSYAKYPTSTKKACIHLEIVNCVLTMSQYHDFVLFLFNGDVDAKFFFSNRQTSLRNIFSINTHSCAAPCA